MGASRKCGINYNRLTAYFPYCGGKL